MATGTPANLNGAYTIRSIESQGFVGLIKEGENKYSEHVVAASSDNESYICSEVGDSFKAFKLECSHHVSMTQQWTITPVNGSPGIHILKTVDRYAIEDCEVGEVHADSNTPAEHWYISEHGKGKDGKMLFTYVKRAMRLHRPSNNY
jgi:hypothetical protein